MKTSTPTTTRPRSPLSILLIGPPGTGKTTLALQFPSPYIADCDLNLDGPERYIRKINPQLSYSYDHILSKDDGTPLSIELGYDRLMQKLDEVKNEPSIKTVIIDSLTQVNEMIIRKLLDRQRRTEMEARDWIPFKSHMLSLLVGKIRALGKDVICTVHESIVWEADAKNIMVKTEKKYEPSVQGSVVDYFGAFFTDVWRCYSTLGAGNTQKFFIQTGRTAKSDLKNSLGMPSEITNSYEEVKKYLPKD